MRMKRTLYAIAALFMALVLSVMVPISAQDDWPEGCELPDLAEAMSAASDAQGEGDVTAFVSHMSAINHQVDGALKTCLIAAAGTGQDLGKLNLSGSNLDGINLRDANLYGTDFSGANLQAADLRGATLEETDLRAAGLQWARLNRANLNGARLWDANLREANLSRASLQGSILSGANLRGAIFAVCEIECFGTNLKEADLSGADLQGADLRLANLKGTSLYQAYLQGTDLRLAGLEGALLDGAIFDENTFLPDITHWTPDIDMARFTDPSHPEFWRGYGLSRANLSGMDYSGANLQSAWIDFANLSHADLSGANLLGANLILSNLQGSDLSMANLQETNITGVTFDHSTILPDNTRWTPETDMARFTDPEHPDFWDPCEELDEQPWYCESEENGE